MKIEIDIRDRLFKELEEYCKREQVDIHEFCEQLIEDAYYTAKYGDLNELVKPKEEEVVVPTPKQEVEVQQVEVVEVPEQEQPKEDVQEEPEVKVEPAKPKRTRRKLL